MNLMPAAFIGHGSPMTAYTLGLADRHSETHTAAEADGSQEPPHVPADASNI